MQTKTSRVRPLRRWVAVAAATAAIAAVGPLALAPQADAHGSVIDPASRNYGCWARWGSDHLNPEMADLDPMCWQAWQADPNAMWNWNGLYLDNVAGDHEGAVPNGQLCSGGMAEGGRYAALDTPGEWVAAEIDDPGNFSIRLHDAALHGADYIRVYVSDDGFDPTTQALGWDDLVLVEESGVFAPGEGERETGNQLGGVSVEVPVSAPGMTGRRVVYTMWKASHSDQTYYLCSDVIFSGEATGGSGGTPGTGGDMGGDTGGDMDGDTGGDTGGDPDTGGDMDGDAGGDTGGDPDTGGDMGGDTGGDPDIGGDTGGDPDTGGDADDGESCEQPSGFLGWLPRIFVPGADCNGNWLVNFIRSLLNSLTS